LRLGSRWKSSHWREVFLLDSAVADNVSHTGPFSGVPAPEKNSDRSPTFVEPDFLSVFLAGHKYSNSPPSSAGTYHIFGPSGTGGMSLIQPDLHQPIAPSGITCSHNCGRASFARGTKTPIVSSLSHSSWYSAVKVVGTALWIGNRLHQHQYATVRHFNFS
jgi:hypothetical protein